MGVVGVPQCGCQEKVMLQPLEGPQTFRGSPSWITSSVSYSNRVKKGARTELYGEARFPQNYDRRMWTTDWLAGRTVSSLRLIDIDAVRQLPSQRLQLPRCAVVRSSSRGACHTDYHVTLLPYQICCEKPPVLI
jgi:hypothetical protein